MNTACSNVARGKEGPQGASSYIYISYATNSVGAGFSMTPSASLKYLQTIVVNAPIPTPTIANFPGSWVKYIGDDGAAGAAGTNGTNGTNGTDGNPGALSFEYVFSNSTSSTDPGTGNMRFNNADVTLASQIFISENIPAGTNISNVFGLLNVPTSAVKGRIQITKKDDANDFAVFDCTLLAAGSPTWFIITSTYVAASATAPFANGDRLIFSFNLTGDKGDAGTDASVVLVNSLTPVAGPGTASTTTLKSFVIPANTLITLGDHINIETLSQNMNPNAGLDFEGITVTLVQGANTWSLGAWSFNNLGESFGTQATVNRSGTTTGTLTKYRLTSSGSAGQLYQSLLLTGVDYTASMTVNIIATESPSGAPPSSPDFLYARRLYVEYIPI